MNYQSWAQNALLRLSPGRPSLSPVASHFFAKAFRVIHHSLVLNTTILMSGLPGCFPMSLCILFYTNMLQPLTRLTCSCLFHPWPPQASRQKEKRRCHSRLEFSCYDFYPQRVLKKWPGCSPAGTWPTVQSWWISSSSCQAALVLVQTHVITCNMDTIPSFLRAPGPSRRKRRQKIKHGRNRRQRSCCCRLCLEQKNEHKGRDRAEG